MKISWIKQEKDDKNFEIAERLGMEVHHLNDPEEVDKTINKLVNENYNMIILSNELAGFSEDIIKKYQTDRNINIIISPRKWTNEQLGTEHLHKLFVIRFAHND